jgi:hypothetical protein
MMLELLESILATWLDHCRRPGEATTFQVLLREQLSSPFWLLTGMALLTYGLYSKTAVVLQSSTS